MLDSTNPLHGGSEMAYKEVIVEHDTTESTSTSLLLVFIIVAVVLVGIGLAVWQPWATAPSHDTTVITQPAAPSQPNTTILNPPSTTIVNPPANPPSDTHTD